MSDINSVLISNIKHDVVIITVRQVSGLRGAVCALQLLPLDLPGQSAAESCRPAVTTGDSSVVFMGCSLIS